MSKKPQIPNKPSQPAASHHLLIQQQEHHTAVSSGPIPSAEELDAYGRVRESLPDTIIQEWQTEAAFRREVTLKKVALEERQIAVSEKAFSHAVRMDLWRLCLGAAFVFGSLALAWLLIETGSPKPAVVVSAIPAVAALISAGIGLFKK